MYSDIRVGDLIEAKHKESCDVVKGFVKRLDDIWVETEGVFLPLVLWEVKVISRKYPIPTKPGLYIKSDLFNPFHQSRVFRFDGVIWTELGREACYDLEVNTVNTEIATTNMMLVPLLPVPKKRV